LKLVKVRDKLQCPGQCKARLSQWQSPAKFTETSADRAPRIIASLFGNIFQKGNPLASNGTCSVRLISDATDISIPSKATCQLTAESFSLCDS
jgi:hypothetical protein